MNLTINQCMRCQHDLAYHSLDGCMLCQCEWTRTDLASRMQR
jgi:hypothetical protein